jgi:hypothetical protein
MEHIRRTFLKGAGTLAASVVTANVAMAQEGSDMKLSHSSNSAEKPAPIITCVSQAEGIAKFALRASYEDLAPERRERLKVSVLDSLACAINALGAPPIVACLEQAKEFGGSDGRCTLIGGGQANVVFAAQYNTAVVRYVDFMDSYLGGEEITVDRHSQVATLTVEQTWDGRAADIIDAGKRQAAKLARQF